MIPELEGPRLPPASGRPRALVVFLHGYGADGNDLIELGVQWRALMPDAAFVAPHAPERCAMAPMGRQWFSLTMRDPAERWTGVCRARPALDAFLDAELARFDLDDGALALVGFSQGTMMALHCGLRRPRAPAAILGFSGALAGAERLGEASARDATGAPPPILLIHGDRDDVLPVSSMFAAANALADANLPCQFHVSYGLGHGIDETGLVAGGLFLARALGRRAGAPT